MKINSQIFINTVSLIALNAIYYGQANSMQQVKTLEKIIYPQTGMSRQYATNNGYPLSGDKKITECDILSKKLAGIIAKNNLIALQPEDIKLELHEGVIHAVRPKNFKYLNVYTNIKQHSLLFNVLLKSAKEGKTFGEPRIRELTDKIQNNQSEFKRLTTALEENKHQGAERMYFNSYELLGIIKSHSNTNTSRSNIE